MLKPSDLGVTGTKRTISAHKKLVVDKLKKLANKKISSVCLGILETENGANVYIPQGVTKPHLQEIQNYFAEVAGPILIAKYNLLPGIKESNYCFYSKSDTEALYDFIVYKQNNPILISNKVADKSSNVLKPSSVIDILDKKENAVLKNKWEKTKQYKAMKILNENNVVSGPAMVVRTFYSSAAGVPVKDIDTILEYMKQGNETVVPKNAVPPSIMRMIKSDPAAMANYTKYGAAPCAMLNFLFEKILMQESKADEKYHDLFVDVTAGNVHFLKFSISDKGKITFYIEDSKKSTKKAFLRSKQGVERRSSSSGKLKLDKMGFQP